MACRQRRSVRHPRHLPRRADWHRMDCIRVPATAGRLDTMLDTIRGKAYVLGDNIDTDQIIPAHYLTYNPAIPEERRQFGRYALSGVPAGQDGLPEGRKPFVDQADPANTRSVYTVVIGGKNFGCGSSREHA